MTKVDFYQVSDDEQPLVFCCRLIDLAWRQGHEIYVHTASASEASTLDQLLWEFRPESFLPHGMLTDATPAPIQLGFGDDPGFHNDVLVNTSGVIPEFFSRFNRVTEIVPHESQLRANARLNYRFYKDRGYPLNFHQLQSS